MYIQDKGYAKAGIIYKYAMFVFKLDFSESSITLPGDIIAKIFTPV